MRESEIQFIRQQGFTNVHPDHRLYVALMFQPRTIAGVLGLGIVLQNAWLFLALSAVLWWGTIVPTRNVFDAVYNRLIAPLRGVPRLPPAPPPRRFAQAMAATVSLTIGAALLSGAPLTAWVFEALFAIGSTSVVVGRVCAPANLYNRLMNPRRALGRLKPADQIHVQNGG
jgi:hypothetical protein